jgi:hypothetical protein
MSSSDEHYRYVYLSLICQRYEQAAKRAGTREGATAATWHSVQTCSMAVDSTEVSLNRFGKANDFLAQKASEQAAKSKKSVSVPPAGRGASQGSGEESFCDAEVDINLGDPSKNSVLNVSLGGTVIEKSQPYKSMLQKSLDEMGVSSEILSADEILDYFDDCFDCDLKTEFSWQIQPLNLLLGFEDFLKDIEEIMDAIGKMLDPMDMLVDLCDFFDGFSLICIPDLIMLLLALSMLIKKYIMMALSISIDWTMILGPIIKWIVDAIAALIQQVMQLVMAPIDCAIGAMRTVQELIDAADELQDTMMAAGSALGDMVGGSGPNLSVSPTPGITATTAANMPGGFMGGDLEGSERWTESGDPIETANAGFSLARDVTNSAGQAVSDATSGFLSFDRNSSGAASENAMPGTIPTGFTVGVSDTFQSFMDKRRKSREDGTNKVPAIGDIKTFQKSILALQDFKQMIADFFSQILFVVKSLNSLFGGKLALNIEAMGIIMLITDLIKLIQIVIALGKGGLKNCDDLKENPEKVMQAISIVYPNEKLSLTSKGDAIQVSNLYQERLIPLPGCTGDLTEEDRSRIRNRISRITGNS